MSLNSEVLDAVRTEDDYRVFIKVVSRVEEIKIAWFLSTKESLAHLNNHCVPILDVLSDPLSASHSLLVMPYLRPFYDPTFEVVEEVLDFLRPIIHPRTRGRASRLLYHEYDDGRTIIVSRRSTSTADSLDPRPFTACSTSEPPRTSRQVLLY